MATFRNLGVNFPLLTLYAALAIDVSILLNGYDLEMDRALTNRFQTTLSFRHVYVDLDDTLLLDGEVNTRLVAFLYQCVNRGIRLHLLSHHAGNLQQILTRYRIRELFDTVYHLQGGEEKAAHVTERDAILIEDSFRERLAVRESTGMPVFDMDAVESLLDDRR